MSAAGLLLPLVPRDEKDELSHMMAAYIGEMSAIIGVPPIAAYPYFDTYWSEPDRRWPHWIEVGGAKAGFAFVCRAEDDRFQIAEFYVAPSQRRRGVGIIAARRLISGRPGGWRITQREQTEPPSPFGIASSTGSSLTKRKRSRPTLSAGCRLS